MKSITKSSSESQLVMILLLVITGGLSLTDEQISSISQILLSAIAPIGEALPSVSSTSSSGTGETIRGMAQLAELLGVSIPTACKLSKSGKFDSARLYFGTKKFVWDKKKLLEIARSENNQ